MDERDWNGGESRDWNNKDSGAGWNTAADEKTIGTIDHYELLRELGTGGFGSVYLARDAVSRTFVAVKGLPQQVSDSASELERIRANYALVSKLKHPNVAAVLALHRVGAVACGDPEVLRKLNVKSGDTLLVMDYAPGVTLDTWCRQFQDRRVPVDQAVEVTRQIAAALDVAHKMKIVHRDIKPQNVMVETLSDGTFTARVLDFGLAAEVRSSVNRVSGDGAKDDKGKGSTSGTLRYMAPEQLEGRRPRVAMDQYALAVLFYELVTGDVPFSSVFECGDKGIIINVVTTKPPEIPAELPRPVRKALARALAKEPKERFATCGDFVAALRGVPPVVPIRWGLVAGILATVAAVGAGVWWLGRSDTPVSNESDKPSVVQTSTIALAPRMAEQIRVQEMPVKKQEPVYDGDALLKLGNLYKQGKGVEQNLEKANEYFQLALKFFEGKIADGDANAMYKIGVMYANGNGVKQDFAKAISWYEKADGQGNAQAQFALGNIYEYGRDRVAKDERKALELYRRAAEKGNIDAIVHLGGMYSGGRGVAQDNKEALRYYFKAAKEECPDACRLIGRTYKYGGSGVEKNDKLSHEWYAKALKLYLEKASLGDAYAQYNLAGMYEYGQGVKKDLDEAVHWFEKAANTGYVHAMQSLGTLFMYKKKDVTSALKWYRKGAECGYDYSQKSLGDMYAEGKGVEKNEREAVKWYREAAKQGHKAAQDALIKLGVGW